MGNFQNTFLEYEKVFNPVEIEFLGVFLDLNRFLKKKNCIKTHFHNYSNLQIH